MSSYPWIDSLVGSGHPDWAEVQRITDYVQSIPFESFYEPVSGLEIAGKVRRLLNLTPDIVNAWVRHVFYSSRVRMLNLERGALAELNDRRLLTAMILIRSHMESAGMASLCHQEIRRWAETNDGSIIKELIPKTFFGTSMVRTQKKAKDLEGALSPSEHDHIPSGQLISALDYFISLGEPNGYAHFQYGLLCDYTHPNMRAVKDHIEIKEFDTEVTGVEGWFHLYKITPEWTEASYIMALHVLMISMKAGHAVCEMLRRTRFSAEGDKGRINFPSNDDIRDIWETFFEQPSGTS
jgi:hypothetical protein